MQPLPSLLMAAGFAVPVQAQEPAVLPVARGVDFTAFDGKSAPQRLALTLDRAWDDGQPVTVYGLVRQELELVAGY